MSNWLLLARSGRDDDLAALASCATAAAARGASVKIVWDGMACDRLLDDRLALSEENEPRWRAAGRPSAAEIFEAGEPVSWFVCSAAAAGRLEVAIEVGAEPVGWATVVDWMETADRVVSF